MGNDFKSIMASMIQSITGAFAVPPGKITDTCAAPGSEWGKSPAEALTYKDLLVMQAMIPPRPPRLSGDICQGCGAEFRPGMPRSVQLGDTGGYACAVCGDKLREMCEETSAATERDGALFVYRGPASGLREWAREIERKQ